MHDRIKKFERVVNFRDFGGYRGHDGRTVARGKLYRSAHFNSVTARDRAQLDAMGVMVLVDLRRGHERDTAPNKWAPPRTIFHDPGPPDEAPAPVVGGYTAETARAAMRAAYVRYPFEARFIMLFGDMFRAIANEECPIIVHCAAGKDRTGLACALVLSALGVDRETIVEDYLATNATLDYETRARLVRARLEPRLGGALSDEAIAPLIGVEAGYLDAALNAIAAASGGLDTYIGATLGVPPETRARMRDVLLV